MNSLKILWLMSVCLLSLSIMLISCDNKQTVLSESEKADIYAVVIRQVYTVDHTFGSNPPNFPVVYLPETTDDTAGDPSSAEANSTVISQSLQSEIVVRLDNLHTEFVWIGDTKEVIESDSSVKGDGAIITLGNIYTQEDGTVQVSASIYISNLAAGGKTYILQLVDGEWKITGTTGPIWIS